MRQILYGVISLNRKLKYVNKILQNIEKQVLGEDFLELPNGIDFNKENEQFSQNSPLFSMVKSNGIKQSVAYSLFL